MTYTEDTLDSQKTLDLKCWEIGSIDNIDHQIKYGEKRNAEERKLRNQQ
ncbi:hypothetical protein [Paraglaciecola sp.]